MKGFIELLIRLLELLLNGSKQPVEKQKTNHLTQAFQLFILVGVIFLVVVIGFYAVVLTIK